MSPECDAVPAPALELEAVTRSAKTSPPLAALSKHLERQLLPLLTASLGVLPCPLGLAPAPALLPFPPPKACRGGGPSLVSIREK
jgi:hypothetical protein